MMWFGFQCMNQIREFDGVLDEKYRHVAADQVVVALGRVELHGKSTYVTHSICRPARTHRR